MSEFLSQLVKTDFLTFSNCKCSLGKISVQNKQNHFLQFFYTVSRATLKVSHSIFSKSNSRVDSCFLTLQLYWNWHIMEWWSLFWRNFSTLLRSLSSRRVEKFHQNKLHHSMMCQFHGIIVFEPRLIKWDKFCGFLFSRFSINHCI